ncbi:MAG: alpha/beta hydrolase [Spirochaetales bacterium]|nr:alpha/beta hydrolase [Spirochaetales bacterium]
MMMDEYFSIIINDSTQWLAIRGDKNKPVLLILHGGPGTPSMNLFRKWNKPLEKDFLVVTWDQRGTGRSNSKDLDRDSLTINQLVEDTCSLTIYLKDQYKKDKIYLMGHSFGTTLALKTIIRYPDDYAAYFGISQFVNASKNESSCYDWLLHEAEARNDKKGLKMLLSVGRPVDGFYKSGLKGTVKVKQLVGKYKGDSLGKSSTFAVLLNLLICKEYRGKNLGRALTGINLSLSTIGYDLKGIDFPMEIKKFSMPLFFFSGRHDRLTPQHLLWEYYEKITAPEKRLFIFEESAHSPLWEESDKFHQIIHELMV